MKSASIFEYLLFVIGGVGVGAGVIVEVGKVELDVYNWYCDLLGGMLESIFKKVFVGVFKSVATTTVSGEVSLDLLYLSIYSAIYFDNIYKTNLEVSAFLDNTRIFNKNHKMYINSLTYNNIPYIC